MLGRILDETFHIAAGKQGQYHVRLAFMVAEVVDGNDMGVVAETPHCLGFAGNALSGIIVQLLGLYKGEGDIPIQYGIMGQVDLLLAALAEEAFDLVAAIGKGGGLGG